MRIISGSLKGKKLFFEKLKTTRPLRDLVKENIFNIILHSNKFKINFEESKILDLYSGTGSFGIECLSRGASSVYFVENESTALACLKKNLIKLKISKKKYIVKEKQVSHFLNDNCKIQFDLIFFDPPYASNFFESDIKMIKKKNFLKEKSLIIFHKELGNDYPLGNKIKVMDVKKYGRSSIIFCRLL
tara:strand:+ start:503 stop:1066 length:564 start_codon:yes stop_codon:yes gene_type:complete